MLWEEMPRFRGWAAATKPQPPHGPGSGRWLCLGQCSAQGSSRGSARRYSDHTKWTAFLGLLDQSKRSATGVQELGLKRIISHPFFNDFTFDYDIALLELETPAEYSSTVRPICLPESSHTFPTGKAIWVTGWGHTQEGGERGLVGLAAAGLPRLPLPGGIEVVQECNGGWAPGGRPGRAPETI